MQKHNNIHYGGTNRPIKENEYLEDIVPTLYTIATQVRDMISASLFKINKIYITGTASGHKQYRLIY